MRSAIMEKKAPKPKVCKNPACKTSFVPQRLGQAVCSPKCALATVEAQKAREKKSLALAGRRDIKVRKAALKTRAEHMKDTQVAFNAWVRARDAGLPCISCGTTADIQYAAGHFRSAGGHPELRFDPLNVHLQCNRNCNMAKSGNLGPYRIELIKRIGQEKVDWLEGPHEPKRYTIDDLKAIKAHYRALARELKRATA